MNRTTGLLAAIGFSVFWASTGVTVRLLDVTPLTIATFRCVFALLVMLPFVLLWYRSLKTWRLLKQNDRGTLVLVAIMVAYIFTVVLSYQLAPVADIVLINGASPIFVLFYKLFRRAKVHQFEVLGSLVALMGLIIVVVPGLFQSSTNFEYKMLGLFIGLISSILIAAYAIVYFSLALKQKSPDPFVTNIKIFLLGAPLFCLLEYCFNGVIMVGSFEKETWLRLLFLGIFSTAVPTICYSIASRLLPPLITTSFRLLTPILASTFAVILFTEIPSITVIPGGILIILGLVMMTFLVKE